MKGKKLKNQLVKQITEKVIEALEKENIQFPIRNKLTITLSIEPKDMEIDNE